MFACNDITVVKGTGCLSSGPGFDSHLLLWKINEWICTISSVNTKLKFNKNIQTFRDLK